MKGLGDGRDSRTCVILEINKLLMIIIFPYGVSYLPFQINISFCISFIFPSIFWSVNMEFLSMIILGQIFIFMHRSIIFMH